METTHTYELAFGLHGTPSKHTAPLETLFARNSPLPAQPFQPKTALEQKVTNATWEFDGTQVVATYETRTPLTEEDQHQLTLLAELELTDQGQTGQDLQEQTGGAVYAAATGNGTLHAVSTPDTDLTLTDADLEGLEDLNASWMPTT